MKKVFDSTYNYAFNARAKMREGLCSPPLVLLSLHETTFLFSIRWEP